MLPQPVNPHRLLLFGKEETLLELRAKVLRSVGLAVDTSVALPDFTNQISISGNTYDGIVCCHTVTETECEEIAAIAGRSRIPLLRLESHLLPPQQLIARVLDLVESGAAGFEST